MLTMTSMMLHRALCRKMIEATSLFPQRLCCPLHPCRWKSYAATQRSPSFSSSTAAVDPSVAQRNRLQYSNLLRYIDAYREHGHRRAQLDPLNLTPPSSGNLFLSLHLLPARACTHPVPSPFALFRSVPEMDPTLYGLHPDDVFPIEGLLSMPQSPSHATAESIQRHLESIYSSTVGVEISHLPLSERSFFTSALESHPPSSSLSPSDRRNAFSLLLQSQTFDEWMAVKFTSTKRYGLEGAESMLPALESILSSAASLGTQQVVLAMPHRGRLNVLTSLLEYPARALFSKVQGKSLVPPGMSGDCDVLSHISTTCSTKRFGNPLTVSLLPNPSHLEAVNPVALGKTRAEQDLLQGSREEREKAVMCVTLHGDAAFAGQGVVAESLTLAYLPGFRVGGTVHLVLNNQVGFTADRPKQRSTLYSSDMARILSCPVIHCNADDVEAVVFACKLAVHYRQHFGKDIVIDLIAYRRRGHNEVDEPAFTQPMMYKVIRERESVVSRYGRQLQEEGLLKKEGVERMRQRLINHLDAELAATKTFIPSAESFFKNQWEGYRQASHTSDHVNTGVEAPILREGALASVALPTDFNLHPRLRRSHVEARVKAVEEGKAIDWATAEAMAFTSLMRDGYDIRLSGQDVERGTFSHRHAVLHDQQTGLAYCPLHHTGYAGRASFVSSNLNEFGVLGFEYGYSLTSPNTLPIWEAQYGDFANCAQPIIDNFISSGETKWLKSSGLVLLLPHGQDATGPEHVTGRVERFLQLCNDDPTSTINSSSPSAPVNMLICNPSTPAQYFHLLRRQQLRPYRKPLILMSPKNLLRHAEAVSRLEEMAPGTTFQSVIGEEVREGVRLLILCSGRMYYELAERREKEGRWDVALVRVEELCPFPWIDVRKQLERWEEAGELKEVKWCQEEPRNAGAWSYVRERLDCLLKEMGKKELVYVGRKPLAAAAVGSAEAHRREVEEIFSRVFQ